MLYVTVGRDGGHVVWAGWRDPATPGVYLPELRCDAGPYEVEVRQATEGGAWEWPGGALARLLEARLRGRADWQERWDCEVEGVWASHTEPDRIPVVLMHPRIRTEPATPWLQFGIPLPVSEDTPPDQTERLEARLTAADPAPSPRSGEARNGTPSSSAIHGRR
ncbi:hypothetical protein [Streptomyces chryseus]|uniref:Uncharacterized protein n=1 Tax=Streptomyces chryseus TaxID=68186 RepID=A0ABQ3E1X4_9ACTN|nr:hypothetical protein [Streptomyces chryseus]GHB22178.1 hypothetical protein GCM10010346_52300 [Streptomyces chryseus]